ncbi:MAG: hypothetical protein A2V70_10180 [Planctomycetes bacterium RBG_13_63_9]|nr:MAG: hypothetical protein A2V70_10180 [Planctomycetes bacterium RBG_13_63_9]
MLESSSPSVMIRLVRLPIMMVPGALLVVVATWGDALGLGGAERGFGTGQVILLVVGLLALCYGVLLHRKAVKDYRRVGRAYVKTVLFIAVPTAIVFCVAVVVADKFVGIIEPPTSPTAGLLFPPNQSVDYATSEYEITVRTNSLGIRDREIDVTEDKSYRILAIGDSFTYGWGVENDEAWPKIAEDRLRAAGCNVQILNLGSPGASPRDYCELTRQSIPLLKPDLVIVAVLQGNDLMQMQFEPPVFPFSPGELAKRFCPNLLRLVSGRCFRRAQKVPASEIRHAWQSIAQRSISELTPEQKQRLEKLDSRTRQAFFSGDLNVHAVLIALHHPDSYSFTLHLDQAEVQDAIGALGKCLKEISHEAAHFGATTEVISVPSAAYVSRKSIESIRRLGFRLSDEALKGDAPDQAIRTACESADVRFHSPSERFRDVAQTESLYFEMDDHFSARGHALLGTTVSEWILEGKVGSVRRPPSIPPAKTASLSSATH